jgi:hypothetical protein
VFLISVPDRNRTYDLQLRRLSLYPAELLGHVYVELESMTNYKMEKHEGQLKNLHTKGTEFLRKDSALFANLVFFFYKI